MRTASESLTGWIAAALLALAAVVAVLVTGGARPAPAMTNAPDPNAGLLRDFLDGKFDSAGHPINARVTEAETLCATAGAPHDGALRLDKACEAALPGAEQRGDLVVSV